MEGAGLAAQQPPAVLALGRSPPSFRLRTQSLNTLRLRRVFDLFDHDGDGVITVQELVLALDRLGLAADPEEIRSAIFDYIPHGRDGLSFDDFEVLHRALDDALLDGSADSEEGADLAAEEDMREAFRVFDEDGDGFISAAELQSVLAKLELPEGRSIDRVREMISSADRNADGLVDFGEFKEMMEDITA